MARRHDLPQGTLDMLVLRVLSRGELPGWDITLTAIIAQAMHAPWA